MNGPIQSTHLELFSEMETAKSTKQPSAKTHNIPNVKIQPPLDFSFLEVKTVEGLLTISLKSLLY